MTKTIGTPQLYFKTPSFKGAFNFSYSSSGVNAFVIGLHSSSNSGS